MKLIYVESSCICRGRPLFPFLTTGQSPHVNLSYCSGTALPADVAKSRTKWASWQLQIVQWNKPVYFCSQRLLPKFWINLEIYFFTLRFRCIGGNGCCADAFCGSVFCRRGCQGRVASRIFSFPTGVITQLAGWADDDYWVVGLSQMGWRAGGSQ